MVSIISGHNFNLNKNNITDNFYTIVNPELFLSRITLNVKISSTYI